MHQHLALWQQTLDGLAVVGGLKGLSDTVASLHFAAQQILTPNRVAEIEPRQRDVPGNNPLRTAATNLHTAFVGRSS